jgi:capsular exopolysaccharide synthesis family protein
MSRIFEALQKSPTGTPSGFSDFTSVLTDPATANPLPDLTVPLPESLEEFPTVALDLPVHSRLFCVTQRESLGAEKFRFLGVRLRQIQQTRGLKKLMITSTIPEEGKSTISANLATTLARKPQHRVLLIDGDMRRPSLGRIFGVKNLDGLSEWLQSDKSVPGNIYRLEGAGFWFMPAGVPPENPLDLLQSPRFTGLMEQLSVWFDWIVIDTPPVLPLADTSVWTKSADGILLVAREGTTRKRQLERGLEALDKSKLLGVVLNNSQSTDHTDYYQHYGPAAKPREH